MIKELSDYSTDEILEFQKASEAFGRYHRLLSTTPESFEDQLRIKRLKAWCRVALATFYSPKQTEAACLYWSQVADEILTEAFQHFELHQENLSLFALGKLGAQELNLSSDVDLIFVSEAPPTDQSLKKVRRFVNTLSQNTALGFCLRVDLDLRPGGKNSPMICSLNQFQDHYWNQAELWERLALVRLRSIVGAESNTKEVLQIRDRFCFRRYVDLSLFDELKKLRPKIHSSAQSQMGADLNLKLAPGFIRDIELFVNANQILLAGKVPRLKTSSTTKACEELARSSPQKDLFETLKGIYWFYRQLENQTQAIQDGHTHNFNPQKPPPHWSWPSQQELSKQSRFVDENISYLLGRKETSTHHLKGSLDLITEKDLSDMGFDISSSASAWEKLKVSTMPIRNQSLDDDYRVKVIQLFLKEFSKSNFDRNLGLNGLADFFSSAKAKSTLFKLLAQEPRLIQDLAYLFSLSPYLGSFFSNRPELIDGFFLNLDEPFSSDLESALLQMSERKRISEIRSALGFLKNLEVHTLTSSLSGVADQITNHLLKIICAEQNVEGLSVIGLGKWGGQELGLRSDLDFIFISDQTITEKHHKVARRFISRLRDHAFGGAIYQVDLRLRPDGKGGSMITSLSQIQEYLTHTASPWERQAYLKARDVANNTGCLHLHDWQRSLSPQEILELKDIRSKLLRPKIGDTLALKYNSGGLIDIELGLQGRILKQNTKPPGTHTNSFFEVLGLGSSELKENYLYLRRVEQLGRILSNSSGDEFQPQTLKSKLCAQVLNLSDDFLHAHLAQILERNRKLLKDIDPIHQI